MQPNVIENFINRSEAIDLNNYLRSIAIMNPKNILSVYLTDIQINNQDSDEVIKFKNLILSLINKINNQFKFSERYLKLDRAMYQVLETGKNIGWHTDTQGGVEGYGENYYSALLYLNDDYEGGEILFYDNNSGSLESATSYKPLPGTLIYFKGDDNYPHSVNNVISGERCNIIYFYRKNE
jgi:predicted 2-oxoglutarate/Fe(II)-dependent dioxygenase YbiX